MPTQLLVGSRTWNITCSAAVLRNILAKKHDAGALEAHHSFWCCGPTAGCGRRGDVVEVQLIFTIFQKLFLVSSVEPAPGVQRLNARLDVCDTDKKIQASTVNGVRQKAGTCPSLSQKVTDHRRNVPCNNTYGTQTRIEYLQDIISWIEA